MCRNVFRLSMTVTMLVVLTAAAQAGIIADWKFGSSAALTTDSSGNGYTLTNVGGVAYGHDTTPAANEPASGNYAVFTGSQHLQTSAALNISGYRELELTWSMKYTGSGSGAVFETSTNFNSNSGAIFADVSENPPGFTPPTGEAGLNIVPGSQWNLADYSHATGTAATWDSYKMVINLDAATNTTVVEVYRNGVLDVNGAAYSQANPIPGHFDFLNDIASIGGRASGGFNFVGDIGEIELQGVPEPSSLLLGLSAIGLLAAGRIRCSARAHRIKAAG